MNGNQYLIPANSKKSMLILGFFRPIDLILFGIGITLTMIMLLFIKTYNVLLMIVMLLPALVTGFLVLPVPNYHNMLQLITNVLNFYSGRKRFYWKGWCVRDEFK